MLMKLTPDQFQTTYNKTDIIIGLNSADAAF